MGVAHGAALGSPAARALLGPIALVGGATIGLGSGFAGLYFSTLPIFLKPVSASFGWHRADTAAVAVVSMLGSALAAPILGLLIDRYDARRVISFSVAFFGILLCVLSLLPRSVGLFAATSFAVGVFAVGTAPAGYLSVLPRMFDRHLGLALSLAMAGTGVGAASFPIVTQALITSFGWRVAYQGLAAAALCFGACALLLLLWAGPLRPKRSAATVSDAVGATLSEALRDRRFWTLTVVVFVATAGGLGAFVHVAALLSDEGMSASKAAAIAALSGVGLLTGRLLGGFAMDFVFAPTIAAVGFVLGAVGIAVVGLHLTSVVPILAVSVFLLGFGLGAEGDFAAFVVRRYFGQQSFGRIYGIVYAAYAIGGVTGPVTFGIAFDRAANYLAPMGLAAAAYVLSAVAVLTLGRYPERFR